MDVHQAGQFKRQTASSNTRPALEGFSSVSGFGYGAGSDASPAFNSDSSLSSTASRLSPEAMLAMQQAHREQQGSSLSRSWPRPRPNFEKTPSSTRNRPADNDLLLPTGVKMPHFGSLAKIDEDSLQPNSYSAADPDQQAPEVEPERLGEFSRALGENLNRDGEDAPVPDEEYIPARQSSPKAPSRRGPRGTSSKYRGVTRHRRTKRWEAHIWDDKKQVYLGGFDIEEHAGKAHDVMALKCRGPGSPLNFGLEEYEELLPMLPTLSKDEVVLLLRRQSKGFVRTSSKFRAITKDRYMAHRLEPRNEPMHRRAKVLYSGSMVYGSPQDAAYGTPAEVQHAAHSLSGLGQMQNGGGMDHDYGDKVDESWGHAANNPWASVNMRSNLSAHRTYASPHSTLSPVLLTPNSAAMSPSAHLLRYAASRDPPHTPMAHAGAHHPASSLQNVDLSEARAFSGTTSGRSHGEDGFGSPTYPSSQPGYLRHRPGSFQASMHTSSADALFSKEVLDPPSRTGEQDMEGYENGQPHHAALPAAHSGAFPSPADYASLLHPDPTQTSQRMADGGLLWHPSLVSPSLLRTVEHWSGQEAHHQGASPAKNVITTPSIHPQPISHYDGALADHERESPELNALANLADAAAIITETDAPGYSNPDMGNGEESHGKGL
ncbi:hypothetical protein CVIRNUC_004961 [Coccomyxa viridis]|uniref:AP2/ERF domain-containing protein n=1 Tax=Coccomyxa viridis TaxID=1274662 RepID=A0AAV1I7I2_9CHLO|nr:hypothetical protein CVIRNUC_004961 [Coccomyxa viridis]